MIPIHDLLRRIQWDPAFSGGDIEIGYLDRVAGGVVFVSMKAITSEAGGSPFLKVLGDDGAVLTVPLHRVREVRRDGRTIWKREAGSP